MTLMCLFELIEALRSVIFTVLFHLREVLEGLEMAPRYLTDGMRSAAQREERKEEEMGAVLRRRS